MNRRPGLLLVGNFLSGAGLNRTMAEEFAERLAENGWQVLTTSRRRNRALRLLDMLFTIWRKRKQYQVAGISVFSNAAFLWAEWSGKLLNALGKPFFLILHGGQLPNFAARNPQRVRSLFSLAKYVIAPSRYLQEQMRPYRQDIQVIPNPLDVQKYPFRLRSQPQTRLVWLRAFHKIYNPGLAVQTLALLPAGSCLKMVGPDKGDGSLQETINTIRASGIEQAVRIVPGVAKQRVGAELSEGDIFLNTSSVDNTPISVLEAMACGLCVVSTNIGGLPYLLKNEEDSLLVPPNDPQAMAQAIQRLLENPSLAEGLSRRARQKAEACDWRVVLPIWQGLLLRMTGGEVK